MKKLVFVMLAISAVGITGCGAGADSTQAPALTWEEFKAKVYQEPDTGAFIANGDELVADETELRREYQRFLEQSQDLQTMGQQLIVNRVNGKDDRWSSTIAQSITYCVSRSSFGNHYSTVVSAMAAAASAWEGTANVNFTHNSGFDDDCSRSTPVVFNVRLGKNGQYLARAFFPSTSRRQREVIIDFTSFRNISPWTLTGILRHELGHTIGFRHEHTRPEAGVCFEDTRWRALTTYDSASVMHYPQCNGSQNGDLVLTTLDKTGARLLYP